MIDQMLAIPKDRKPLNVGRLCLLLGLTVLLYIVIAHQIGPTGRIFPSLPHV